MKKSCSGMSKIASNPGKYPNPICMLTSGPAAAAPPVVEIADASAEDTADGAAREGEEEEPPEDDQVAEPEAGHESDKDVD